MPATGHICSTLLRTIACVLRHSLLQQRIAGPATCSVHVVGMDVVRGPVAYLFIYLFVYDDDGDDDDDDNNNNNILTL